MKHHELMHQDFKIVECGLFIHKDHGFIGALPDGVTFYICRGEGVCKIKVKMQHFFATLPSISLTISVA